jgi:hypothetical protein
MIVREHGDPGEIAERVDVGIEIGDVEWVEQPRAVWTVEQMARAAARLVWMGKPLDAAIELGNVG